MTAFSMSGLPHVRLRDQPARIAGPVWAVQVGRETWAVCAVESVANAAAIAVAQHLGARHVVLADGRRVAVL